MNLVQLDVNSLPVPAGYTLHLYQKKTSR